MSKQLLGAVAVLMMTAPLAMAQTQAPAVQKDACCQKACADACCCTGGGCVEFEVEATFFRYHREDGLNVNANPADPAEFDFDAGYRLSGMWQGNNGLGYRVRYWEHDANTVSAGGNTVTVDTYNVDFEAVYNVELDCCTCLEVSTGIRYNYFKEDGIVSTVANVSSQNFDGIGGIVALELTRDLNCNTSLYTRVRHGIMMGDANFDTSTGTPQEVVDVTRHITEIAFGLNYCCCGWDLHAGVEWQNWGSYVAAPPVPAVETESVGFGGFVIGAEFSY